MLGNKILIIGCAGSGKTTLAKKLYDLIDIPIIHLDRFYWTDNWGKMTDTEWEATIKSLCQSDRWIMEGNYSSTIPLRMKYATSVIYLDLPRWTCLFRVFIRRFRFLHNKNRSDLPPNCPERINLKFYKWVWNYPNRSRQKTLHRLKRFHGSTYFLRTNKDINHFLSSLSNDS